MKKILKKMVLLTLLVVLSTTTTYSKSISIKGIMEILQVVTKIYTQQQLMGSEQLQQGMSLITQIDNQVKQINNQYEMLKRLSEQISEGNLLYLEDYYRECGYMLDSYNSIMLDTEKLSDEFMKLFKLNPEEFKKLGFGKEYMEKMDKNIREARQMSDTALYDVMTSKGFTAKIGADEQNLQTLLKASQSSTGVVETLQITNSLLGQISANISQLGVLNETASKAQAMATNTESEEIKQAKDKLEEAKKGQEEIENKTMEKLKEKTGKKIRI